MKTSWLCDDATLIPLCATCKAVPPTAAPQSEGELCLTAARSSHSVLHLCQSSKGWPFVHVCERKHGWISSTHKVMCVIWPVWAEHWSIPKDHFGFPGLLNNSLNQSFCRLCWSSAEVFYQSHFSLSLTLPFYHPPPPPPPQPTRASTLDSAQSTSRHAGPWWWCRCCWASSASLSVWWAWSAPRWETTTRPLRLALLWREELSFC